MATESSPDALSTTTIGPSVVSSSRCATAASSLALFRLAMTKEVRGVDVTTG
ncbi:Uncharacterised protein [Mycobacteroides abscessus subsp. abscessus]|nr:Uncharacterised protein [Mycobacteroides abscessus subsp. abscessus]